MVGIQKFICATWVIALWAALTETGVISERYFPSPSNVLLALVDVSNNLLLHFSASSLRIVVGYNAAVGISLLLGSILYRSDQASKIFMPLIQGIRAVPATATVPFFILWFGFSEIGKFFVILFGISFNLMIAVTQVLRELDEKYVVAFRGFGFAKHSIPLRILCIFALQNLLPTLRFSLTVGIGLSVVAEYLGAQTGLGYLIQSARATYSLDLVAGCAMLFGLITFVSDWLVRFFWKVMIPWKKEDPEVG